MCNYATLTAHSIKSYKLSKEFFEGIGTDYITLHNKSTFLAPAFIHLAVCFTTGPKPLPKPALHIVRSRASSFK
jgi:hypothetical protein